MLETEAWRHLSPIAVKLWLHLAWLYNGSNNSQLFCSVRSAGEAIGCRPDTANAAFKDLIAKGFIRPNQKGDFHYKEKHATEWTLTHRPADTSSGKVPPTRDYHTWRPDPTDQRKKPVPKTVTDHTKNRDRSGSMVAYEGENCHGNPDRSHGNGGLSVTDSVTHIHSNHGGRGSEPSAPVVGAVAPKGIDRPHVRHIVGALHGPHGIDLEHIPEMLKRLSPKERQEVAANLMTPERAAELAKLLVDRAGRPRHRDRPVPAFLQDRRRHRARAVG